MRNLADAVRVGGLEPWKKILRLLVRAPSRVESGKHKISGMYCIILEESPFQSASPIFTPYHITSYHPLGRVKWVPAGQTKCL